MKPVLADFRARSLQTQSKTSKVRIAFAVISGLVHATQMLVFLALGQPKIAFASFAALLAFTSMAGLVMAGHARLGGWVGYLETLAHISFHMWILGPGAGYWLYFVPVSGAAYLNFAPHEKTDRVVAVGGTLALAALLLILSKGHVPIVPLGTNVLYGLTLMNAFGALMGEMGVIIWFSRVADRAEHEVETERARSEKILQSTLPSEIALRLKNGERTIADLVPSVTVLFADLVGFTALSARIPNRKLITMLNDIFSDFDALAEKHGVEKIKTIGDAYMVVGGVPHERPDHACAVARMALDMRKTLARNSVSMGEALGIRIGIHSGPVIAGVIGTHKLAYDLWGDTVNVASRMESHSAPGEIQVTDATRELLASEFVLRERGVIAVKGRGEMRTWFLEGETESAFRILKEGSSRSARPSAPDKPEDSTPRRAR